jgi:micrococcal nuclease
MKKLYILISILLITLIPIGFFYFGSTDKSVYAEVTKVIDGDTIQVNSNGRIETIRLIGIDTPEIGTKYKAGEKGGELASSTAKRLLMSNTDNNRVKLVSDPQLNNTDKYGRLLRYVYLNELDYGQYMIQEGYATEFTYLSDYQKQGDYRTKQSEAKKQQKGVWNEDYKGN